MLDGLLTLTDSVGEVGVAGADPLPDSPLFRRAFTSDLASRKRSAAPENKPVKQVKTILKIQPHDTAYGLPSASDLKQMRPDPGMDCWKDNEGTHQQSQQSCSIRAGSCQNHEAMLVQCLFH